MTKTRRILVLVGVLSLFILVGCTQNIVKSYNDSTDSENGNDKGFASSSTDPFGLNFSFLYPSDYTMTYQELDTSFFTAYCRGPVTEPDLYNSPLITVDIARIGEFAPKAKIAIQESILDLKRGTILDFYPHKNLFFEEYMVKVGEIQGWELTASFTTELVVNNGNSSEIGINLRTVFFDYHKYTYRISVISSASSFDSAVSAYEHLLNTFKIIE